MVDSRGGGLLPAMRRATWIQSQGVEMSNGSAVSKRYCIRHTNPWDSNTYLFADGYKADRGYWVFYREYHGEHIEILPVKIDDVESITEE